MKLEMVSRADRWVLLFALLGVAMSWVSMVRGGGREVVVTQGDRVIARLPLERSTRLAVTGPLGVSIVEVEGGRARFVSSPCSTRFCVHSGWLQRAGAFTACLPNRVSLRVMGGEPRYDSINF